VCDGVQVLKGRLSVHQPTIMCDGFVYEEGEDLDEDELEANAANLPKTLQSLPGRVFWQCRKKPRRLLQLLISVLACLEVPLSTCPRPYRVYQVGLSAQAKEPETAGQAVYQSAGLLGSTAVNLPHDDRGA